MMAKGKKSINPIKAWPLIGLCLFSCSSVATEDGFAAELTYSDGFTVMQLADLHYNIGTDADFIDEYVDRLYEEVEPDLVILTGDNVLTGTKQSVIRMMEMLESHEVPYTFAFGNHDYQGIYSSTWLSETLADTETYPHSLYAEAKDLAGHSNSYINLVNGDELVYQIYVFDTGVNDATGILSYDYDSLDESQVDWYIEQAEAAKEQNGGEYVPSVFYYHVPIPTYQEAYDSEDSEKLGGYLLEGFYIGSGDAGLFDAAKERDCLAMFCGHDHANSYTQEYEGVVLGYGVKTGPELYYGTVREEESPFGEEFVLSGASALTFHDDRISLTHHYLSFDMSWYQSEAIV